MQWFSKRVYQSVYDLIYPFHRVIVHNDHNIHSSHVQKDQRLSVEDKPTHESATCIDVDKVKTVRIKGIL